MEKISICTYPGFGRGGNQIKKKVKEKSAKI